MYDVFLSYSRQDKAWAEKLRKSLVGKNFNVFFDQESLRSGEFWEEQLGAALEDSQHLVVLWSDHARSSDWVLREIYEFDARVTARARLSAPQQNRDLLEAQSKARAERRRILVNLQGHYAALRSLQAIDNLATAGIYGSGVDKLDVKQQELWKQVVDKLASDLRSTDHAIPIACTVLAMTESECALLNLAEDKKIGVPLGGLLNGLGIKTLADLKARYGERRDQWRPFKGDKSVSDILGDVLDQLNRKVKAKGISFRWDPVDVLDTPYEVAAEMAERLNDEYGIPRDKLPPVLVIDPLSLYSATVSDRFKLIDACFKNRNAVVAVLGPRPTDAGTQLLRQVTQRIIHPHIRDYFNPPIEKKPLPSSFPFPFWGPTVQDEDDLRRLVVASVGNAPWPKRKHPFSTTGI